MQTKEGLRTVLLLSGSGSTAEAIVKATRDGGVLEGKINPVGAIISRSDAGGIKRLQDLEVDVHVLDRRQLGREGFSERLYETLEELGPELISQNGWIPRTPTNIIRHFSENGVIMINQHPGPLDPGRVDSNGDNLDFGGKGMHGLAPTAARLAFVWAANEYPTTESSVHLVTESGYDNGGLVETGELLMPQLDYMTSVGELAEDPELREHLTRTAIEVQKQLLPIEHATVIRAMGNISEFYEEGPFHRIKPLIEPGKEYILYAAKKLGEEIAMAA